MTSMQEDFVVSVCWKGLLIRIDEVIARRIYAFFQHQMQLPSSESHVEACYARFIPHLTCPGAPGGLCQGALLAPGQAPQPLTFINGLGPARSSPSPHVYQRALGQPGPPPPLTSIGKPLTSIGLLRPLTSFGRPWPSPGAL